jgi:NADH:ubiquinone oxidoreductase subunit F (NADH-binding)
VQQARAAGILGPSVLGSGFACDVAVLPGLGSYVCGEETALLNAIEGRRGEVRLRPPYPAEAGLFGCPTVVNNVETLANVPAILERGPEAYSALGTARSPGTKVLCLSRGFARPGLVEVEFGTPLARVIEEAGGGRDGRALEGVLLGGPMGSIVWREAFDVPVGYEEMAERKIQLGHGGVVALLAGTDWTALALHLARFAADESCGRCYPCALGSRELLRRLRAGASLAQVADLFEVMESASLCAFGQLVPGPLRALLARLARHGGAA